MHRRALGLFAAVAFGVAAGQASAADLPRKAPPAPPPPPPFSWTGFYIGGNIGGGWGHNDFTTTPSDLWLATEGAAEFNFLSALQSPSHNVSGFVAGGQIGYNYQTGPVVWGIEADGRWMDLNEDRTVGPITGPFGNPTVVTTHSENNWLVTVRGRLGYAGWERVLLYVTGGFAAGHVEASLNVFRPTTGYNSFGSVDDTQTGWTVGGGIEWAFAPHWSVKAEYLYVDLGNSNFTTQQTNTLFSPLFFENSSVNTKLNIATVGVNYRF